jgi:hypothetical protein
LTRVIPPLAQLLSKEGIERPLPSSRVPPIRWNPRTTAWENQSRWQPGLWRVVDRYSGRRLIGVVQDDKFAELKDLGLGHAIAAAMEGVAQASYDAREGQVRVLRGHLLPRLHARALALCSGLVPKRGPAHETLFSNVPNDIAASILLKLQIRV